MGLPGDAPGTDLLTARDRVLLYTRTLGLEPIAELTLAGEALGGIPAGTGGPESVRLAMDALDERLNTQDAPPSPAQYVQPPLNRRPMMAEPMERNLFRPLFSRSRSCQPDRSDPPTPSDRPDHDNT